MLNWLVFAKEEAVKSRLNISEGVNAVEVLKRHQNQSAGFVGVGNTTGAFDQRGRRAEVSAVRKTFNQCIK